MRTDRLIDILAQGAGPAPRALAARRLSWAAAFGLAASAALALAAFGAIPGPLFGTAVPWTKLAYGGALACAAAWLAARLSQPSARTGAAWRTTGAVVLAMAIVGAVSLGLEPAGDRAGALLGRSWSSCPANVVALSLPALAAALWALGGLAPTRPRLAGFAAGLLAGALGACGYALSCPEPSPAFVATWYTLGMLGTGALGAVLGPRVLRW